MIAFSSSKFVLFVKNINLPRPKLELSILKDKELSRYFVGIKQFKYGVT